MSVPEYTARSGFLDKPTADACLYRMAYQFVSKAHTSLYNRTVTTNKDVLMAMAPVAVQAVSEVVSVLANNRMYTDGFGVRDSLNMSGEG